MEISALIETLISFVLGNFLSLPQAAQAFILLVMVFVTIAAHIAPYTATKKDDFLIGHKSRLIGVVKKFFALVAGNYGNAKNHTKVQEEKSELKQAKSK